MTQSNFLIENSEYPVLNVEQNSDSLDKIHPYEYEERANILNHQISRALDEIDELPDAACPNDEAVIAITLHPDYLAKSYHLSGILTETGLRQVGSREKKIEPLQSMRESPIIKTTELFIAGPRKTLRQLLPTRHEKVSNIFKKDFRKIETVRCLGLERIKGKIPVGNKLPLEVVLHISGDRENGEYIYSGFKQWCDKINVRILGNHVAGGLSFVNARADSDVINDLIRFSFLRLVRRMPKLSFRAVTPKASAGKTT